MRRRTTQVNRSRDWDGLLRFEYAVEPSKNGTLGTSDVLSDLERAVREQGERIVRLEASWLTPIDRKHRRYTKQ